MKSKSIKSAVWLGTAVLLILSCWVANAWAATGFEFTREIYDLIMRWVNFIILAALIIKYGRRPIANFLQEQKEDVAANIQKFETQKQAVQEKLQQSQKQLTASEDRLELIKSRIIAEGEKRKEQLIADAQKESRMMIEMAKLRIAHQLREVHTHLKTELIDTAAQIAITKLPDILTAADQDKLLLQWVDAVQS